MPEASGARLDPTGHCVTCGDVGIEMEVLRVDEPRGLALCADARGKHSTVEIGLVEAQPGARLLVHAGTAIARLEERGA